jgi:hypothetical protein
MGHQDLARRPEVVDTSYNRWLALQKHDLEWEAVSIVGKTGTVHGQNEYAV